MAKGKKNNKPEEKAKPGKSAIKSCNCKHEYQDSKYGKGNRVKICNTSGTYVCTVCGRS